MRKYVIQLMSVMLALMLLACSDSDSLPQKTCAIKGFTIEDDAGTSVRYENVYNTDSLIQETTVYTMSGGEEKIFMKTALSYDSDGKLISMVSRRSSGEVYKPLSFTFKYDDRGRQIAQISQNGVYMGITYNNDDYIRKLVYFADGEGSDTSNYYLNTFDGRGNVITQDLYRNVEGTMVKSSTVNLEYDNQKNPMQGYYYDFAEEPEALLSANNITKKTTVFLGSSSTTIESFVYTYNSNGYPDSKDSDLSSGSLITYTYACPD